MTTIIATIGQKGGVGKSTIARLLAVEGAKRGLSVRLCDLDPGQGTSVEWKQRRDAAELDPDIAVEKCRTPQAALAYVGACDLLVIDTPAFMDKRSLDVAKAAHTVVMPTGLSEDDLRPQVLAAYELIDKGVPADRIAYAFCRARTGGSELEEAQRYLRTTGCAMLLPAMREMPSVRQAHNRGGCASETGFASVDTEARALADAIFTFAGVAQPTQE
jgi:chromosome partitioning protein